MISQQENKDFLVLDFLLLVLAENKIKTHLKI
jgi:hypothetical protein